MSEAAMKRCNICGESKPDDFDHFVGKTYKGVKITSTPCKACNRRRASAWYAANPERGKANGRRNYYANHEESIQASRAWREANPERNRQIKKDWYATHKQHAANQARIWVRNNPQRRKEILKAWHTKEYRDSANYRERLRLCGRLRYALIKKKTDEFIPLVSCSTAKLREHFEKQFSLEMSWDTYGRQSWEIDHIRPCHTFDLTDPKQVAECFHYTNLRPLTYLENLKKGKSYEQN